MDDKTIRLLERRWAYEHSSKYLTEVTLEKMRLQEQRDGSPISQIVSYSLSAYLLR